MCLRECGEAGYRLWNEWSKTSPKYKAGECRKKWMRDIKPGKGLSFESVFKMAQGEGWKNPLGSKAKKVEDDDYDFGVILSQIPDNRIIKVDETKVANVGGLGRIKASDIDPDEPKWIWPGYIERGEINLLAGDAGCGKTMLACAIMSVVSNGGTFPDGSEAEQGRVVMFTTEDSLTKTLVPRLMAAEANLEYIEFTRGCFDAAGKRKRFDPKGSLQVVADSFLAEPFDLLVLDSITDFVGGDSHKNEDVRAGLDRLRELAEQLEFGILGIMHQAKGSAGQKLQHRVLGSVGYVGKARVVMNASKGTDGCPSVFGVSKANNTDTDKGFQYDIEDGEYETGGYIKHAKRIKWLDELHGIQEAIDATEGVVQPRRGPKTEKGQDCKGFILGFLENGPAQWDALLDEFSPTGVSKSTMERARDGLKAEGAIITCKCKTDGKYYWFIEGNDGGMEFYDKRKT
jgi:putative DNA primase/helicase